MMQNGSALAGVKVLDLTQFEAGPACTEVLAWLGAEVVKVENPNGGDQLRRLGSIDGERDSYFFVLFNANKKSITCNLKTDEGLALVKDLIKEVDVVVENFGPGVIERLGLGYDDVKSINPQIIYSQLKGFAEGSPYEDLLAFDMIGQATGGIMSVTGEADRMPVKPGPNFADTGTGMLMAISILGALYQKQATGQGQRLTVAMQDAMMQYARFPLSDFMATGEAPSRSAEGIITGGNAPMGLFPCKPGGSNDYVYIYVNRANNRQWHRLLELIGRADLVGDARFETSADRYRNKIEIDDLIMPWTRQRTKDEAMELIGRAGVPAGAVFDFKELSENPDFERREIFQWIDHPTLGRVKMLAWPVKMSGNNVSLEAAPLLGQHTETVLSEWLGLSPEKIQELSRDGVI
ncbi:MAG: crotonobetainyl-CoA:carnitine CoA-transferase CaiB-like acyl-CoA transferase [Hyphomicrobiaceae bacterium]|jgi:crotonobetainyl-CoA:carnitine CoA-transferase CaiB-like acyl-CoA transferase